MTRESIINNILWFLGSLFLGGLVWFVATIQADPIGTVQYSNVPIQIEYDTETLIITNEPSQSARVEIRAQQSVIRSLTREDIVVRADLTGRAAGTHTVPLQVELSRNGVADTQPLQVTVALEPLVAEQKPVNISIANAPSIAFRYSEPQFDLPQAVVRGAQDDVGSVVEVRGLMDLSDRRMSFTEEVMLTAMDADGRPVRDVTVEPRGVSVSVDISQREDVLPVSVQPRLGIPPEGYIATIRGYEPQFVFLGGTPESLRQVGATVFTEEIPLFGRTGDFEASVSIELPFDDLVVLNEEATVTVDVSIEARRGTVQIDNIELDIIGEPAEGTVTVQPDTVSVVLVGPEPVIQDIDPDDIQAFIDLNNLGPGATSVAPTVQIAQSPADVEWSTLPQSIGVTITPPTPPGTEPADNS